MTLVQKIIIFSFILLIFLMLLALIFPYLKYSFSKKRHLYHYGKKIYKIALYNDFYLINQGVLRFNENDVVHYDHILFGDKFIYVIKDRYFVGSLKGTAKDDFFLFYPFFKPKSQSIPNPILKNAERIERLINFSSLHPNYFINLVVVNDDLVFEDVGTITGREYFVKIGQLPKIIQAIEKRDIPELESQKLAKAVLDLAKVLKGK